MWRRISPAQSLPTFAPNRELCVLTHGGLGIGSSKPLYASITICVLVRWDTTYMRKRGRPCRRKRPYRALCIFLRKRTSICNHGSRRLNCAHLPYAQAYSAYLHLQVLANVSMYVVTCTIACHRGALIAVSLRFGCVSASTTLDQRAGDLHVLMLKICA